MQAQPQDGRSSKTAADKTSVQHDRRIAGAVSPAIRPSIDTSYAEQGLPGFDSTSWAGLVAPVHTPPAVTAKLIAEVEKVVKSPDIAARITELGSQPGTAFGKDFARFMQAETAKWAAVIRTSGARAD